MNKMDNSQNLVTTTQQEELPIPLTDRRYLVGWGTEGLNGHTRQVVFVVDKWSFRIVYKFISKYKVVDGKEWRKTKVYPTIEKMYDKKNCVPGRPLNIKLFE